MKLRFTKLAALLVLAGALVVTLTSVALAGPPWSDASASWWVSSYGVTESEVATVADGFPDGTFRPGTAVTRGQFAKMAVSGLEVATADPAKATFKDVIPSHRFYVYVEGAYAKELIGGYPSSDGLLFKPDSKITRQQANSILGRYLSNLEISITGSIHGDVTTYGTLDLWYKVEGTFWLGKFDDQNKVGADHRATSAYLVYRKIVEGSNSKLSPASTLTRSQAAALILRVRAESQAIMTPPGAPTNLGVVATGDGRTVFYNSALQQFMGNDSTPQVTGDTLASRPLAVYDQGVKLVEDSSNSAGKFYADVSSALADGLHSFTAKVKNDNGLVSPASAAVTYVLDTTSPAGAVTKPSIPVGGTTAVVTTSKPEFTATATDAGSGVKQVTFQVAVKTATLAWQTVSIDTTPETGTTYAAVWPTSGALTNGLVEGQYLFRAVVVDNVGNEYTSATVDVTLDTGGPTVTITAPRPATGAIFYTESRTPLFTANVTDSTGAGSGGVASVQFYYAPWSETGKPTAWAGFIEVYRDTAPDWAAVYSGSGIPEGHWILAVKATDSVGNESPLMNGTVYATGVTQEVVIDATAPVVFVTSPLGGQALAEGQPHNITWSVADVTEPDTVKIEYTLDASAVFPDWMVIEAATPNDDLHPWNVPDISGDKTHAQIRVTAIDRVGRSTVGYSGQFTIWDIPLSVTGLFANDPDSEPGVDGRDFHAVWTVSTSPDIVSQRVFILPTSFSTVDLGAHVSVATFSDNTTHEWTGTAALLTDSRNLGLSAGSYRVWLLVTDVGGRTQVVASDPFTVTDP